MLHKLAIIGVLASILYIVYTSMYKGYILPVMLVVLALLAALYYVTTSVVTSGMVRRKEGRNAISFKGGLVDKNNLIPGRLFFDAERIVFYKRMGDLGGLSECFSIPVKELDSYNVGKINEYHNGIKLMTAEGKEYDVKCSAMIKGEKLFTDTIGWVVSENEED